MVAKAAAAAMAIFFQEVVNMVPIAVAAVLIHVLHERLYLPTPKISLV